MCGVCNQQSENRENNINNIQAIRLNTEWWDVGWNACPCSQAINQISNEDEMLNISYSSEI